MSAQESRAYFAVQATARVLQVAADQAVAEVGATTSQLAVMAVIADQQATNQRVIADALEINESAVTAHLGRLEKLGFVERSRDESDRRARRVELTPQGRAAGRRAKTAFNHVNRAMDAALNPDELRQLTSLLNRLRNSIDPG